MTIEIFSGILTVGALALFLVLFVCGCASLFSPRYRQRLAAYTYENYLIAIGAIALVSTLAALVYQYIYDLEVCALCWWQRIFMFPIEIVIFVALYFRQKYAHVTTAILAVIGGAIALHHYNNHFQNIVLGKQVILPCAQIGLVPSCSDFAFTVFGFMTIPGMALLAFVSIGILSFLAHRAQK